MLCIWTIHRWRGFKLVEQYPVFNSLSLSYYQLSEFLLGGNGSIANLSFDVMEDL